MLYNTKVCSVKNKRYDPLAQLVEHMTFNHGVPGSSPGWVTKVVERWLNPSFLLLRCGCGEIGRRARLRI